MSLTPHAFVTLCTSGLWPDVITKQLCLRKSSWPSIPSNMFFSYLQKTPCYSIQVSRIKGFIQAVTLKLCFSRLLKVGLPFSLYFPLLALTTISHV